MRALRAFFPIMNRWAVFWLGTLGVLTVLALVAGMSKPDKNSIELYGDAIFVAAFLAPGSAGTIVGSIIREFQLTTFAMFLPAVRFRLATGFVVTGLVVTLTVASLIAMSSSPQNLALLFVIGIGAYFLGGILVDPSSGWVTGFNVILAVGAILSSAFLHRVADENPWLTLAVSTGIAAICVSRLFARSTFRHRSVLATSPLPSSISLLATSPLPSHISLEKNSQNRRQKLMQGGPVKPGWMTTHFGQNLWIWTRAAVYETYGTYVLRYFVKAISRAWAIVAIFLLHTWMDKAEMGLGQALAKSLHDALFRSPFQAQFGERGGPYKMVAIVIALAGVLTALYSSVTLRDTLSYPLSRLQRAAVEFRGGLIDSAIFLLIASPCLFALGHFAGWYVGYEIRFDFMPFFFRVLMLTLVLMPLGYWGRAQLQEATWRKSQNILVGVIIGVCWFIIMVSFLTLVFTQLFTSALVELGVLTIALLISRVLYWRSLVNFYTTADLA